MKNDSLLCTRNNLSGFDESATSLGSQCPKWVIQSGPGTTARVNYQTSSEHIHLGISLSMPLDGSPAVVVITIVNNTTLFKTGNFLVLTTKRAATPASCINRNTLVEGVQAESMLSGGEGIGHSVVITDTEYGKVTLSVALFRIIKNNISQVSLSSNNDNNNNNDNNRDFNRENSNNEDRRFRSRWIGLNNTDPWVSSCIQR